VSSDREGAKKSKILVIGATGQDGKLLVERLQPRGHELICVGNPNVKKPDFEQKALERVDLSNSKIALQFLSDVNPRVIFHLAAVHGNSLNMRNEELLRSKEMTDCNLGITSNVLEWQKNYSKKSKSVIALSSFIFAGGDHSGRINLSTSPSPKSLYGSLKNQVWQLIRNYRENFGVKTTGLILFNHTSEFSKPDFLLPTLAQKINILRKNPDSRITINLANRLIDISDARSFTSGFESLIDYEVPRDFIFSSGRLISIRDIVTASVLEINRELLDRIDFVEDCTDRNAIFGDISDTEELLNWKPTQTGASILTNLIMSQYSLAPVNQMVRR
jgi:nucleoside-diphosphate-sugar epimerase